MYALLDASLHHASTRGAAAATERRNRAWGLINEKYTTDGGQQLFLRGQEHDFSELLCMCAQEAFKVAPDHAFLNTLLFVEYGFACDVCNTHATGDDAAQFRHLALYKPDGFCYAYPLEVSLFCCGDPYFRFLPLPPALRLCDCRAAGALNAKFTHLHGFHCTYRQSFTRRISCASLGAVGTAREVSHATAPRSAAYPLSSSVNPAAASNR